MAVKKEQLALDSEAARQRPIELITENGFIIVRAADFGGTATPPFGSFIFLVRDPNDYELEITVEIEPTVLNQIVLHSRGRLSRESSFWICCAERHLADYLGEHDDYPPHATLQVAIVTLRDIDLAHRWGSEH